MNDRNDLLQHLHRLKRDERELKTEELDIRKVKAEKDQRARLAQNHEKRMKNKSKQALITTELRKLDAPAASLPGATVGPPIARVTGNKSWPPVPPHGDSIEL